MRKILPILISFMILSGCEDRTGITITPEETPDIETSSSLLIKDLYPDMTFTYGNIMKDSFSDIAISDLEDTTFLLSREELMMREDLRIENYDYTWCDRIDEHYRDVEKPGFALHDLNNSNIEVELSEMMNGIEEDNVLYWPEISLKGDDMIAFGVKYEDSYLYKILDGHDAYKYNGDIESFFAHKGFAYRIGIDEGYLWIQMISDKEENKTLIYAIASIENDVYRCYYAVDASLNV